MQNSMNDFLNTYQNLERMAVPDSLKEKVLARVEREREKGLRVSKRLLWVAASLAFFLLSIEGLQLYKEWHSPSNSSYTQLTYQIPLNFYE